VTTDRPTLAPPDWRTRPPHFEEDSPWFERRTGPGWPCDLGCPDCGHAGNNLCICYEYSCGATGDAVVREEICCAGCGWYALHVRPG